ncbi:LysR family transcriptional regulator [Paraglaciecola aquimarina]|uniref:LysR family transcriptional regulator n=1 Tax=Paraglaciecola algarum TaxID=3050085 RepID=A0ABS9D5T6_9ALTE|nr:LysR family transcriptional regulator [Paraglaciecola sp. G1-23]MCF2948049.1 LysR family transcriptional regulator [Paraglaciecola sp. G1-23]
MHSWDDFKIFLSVAETGSYSASARKMGVNHSTISRRIQNLESAHGVKLFERTTKGYQLTDAGEAIFDVVLQASEATNQASRMLSGHDDRLEGEIKLTMPHEIFDRFLAKPLAQFCVDYPQIKINLGVKPGLKNIANREADLAVRITPEPPEYLIGRRVTYMQHGLYVNAHWAEKIKNGAQNVPLVLWPHIKGLPEWSSHFSNPQVAMYVDDLSSMYEAVRAGMGVARMPCFYPDSVNDASVIRLPIEQDLSNWGIWLLNHVDLRYSARINKCKQLLALHLEKHIPLFLGAFSK